METTTERILQSDEGVSPPDENYGIVLDNPFPASTPFVNPDSPPVEVHESEPVEAGPRKPPPGYEGVIQELWPDENGKLPEVTEEFLRRLRGKYFTVKHVFMKDCGHRLDMINEPRHRHCQNCWFNWFNVHPQLIEIADQMFRTQGRLAMEGLRGTHFVKMFIRFMATIARFQQEQEKTNDAANQERSDASRIDGKEPGQAREGYQVGSEAITDGSTSTGLSSGIITQS